MTFPISPDNICPLVTIYEFSPNNQHQNKSVGNGSKHFFHTRFHNEMVRIKYHGMRNISSYNNLVIFLDLEYYELNVGSTWHKSDIMIGVASFATLGYLWSKKHVSN